MSFLTVRTPVFAKIFLFCVLLTPFIGTAQAQNSAGSRTHKLQVGTDIFSTFREESPFINHAKALSGNWRVITDRGVFSGQSALDAGYYNLTTGVPQNLPTDGRYASGGVFFRGGQVFPDYHKGDYTLRWKGSGHGEMSTWRRQETSRSSNRVDFTLDRSTIRPSPLSFRTAGRSLNDVEFFETEYENLLNRGKIWHPRFVNYAKRYDIIRTMNFQNAVGWPQRSFKEVATLDEMWGRRLQIQWPQPKTYGVPYEALFELGVETGREIWLHVPIMIGSPISPAHPSLRRNDRSDRVDFDLFESASKRNAFRALASNEWENFANEFVDRYISSGYPMTRPLYIEMANEVWNFSGTFKFATQYASGVGNAFNSDWNLRYGYGILTARWMIALEAAFKDRGIDPNVVYVVASQTSSARATQHAFTGIRYYLRDQGYDPDDFLPKTGVAVASYHGFTFALEPAIFENFSRDNVQNLWENAITRNPRGLVRDIKDTLLNGPSSLVGTRNWILESWKIQERIAQRNKSKFLGSYEGGNHLVPNFRHRRSEIFNNWWRDYYLGSDAADIVRQINKSLIAEFPNAIISNYGSVGLPDQNPWIDGHYANWTPMLEMWDEFAIPGHAGPPSDRP